MNTLLICNWQLRTRWIKIVFNGSKSRRIKTEFHPQHMFKLQGIQQQKMEERMTLH